MEVEDWEGEKLEIGLFGVYRTLEPPEVISKCSQGWVRANWREG